MGSNKATRMKRRRTVRLSAFFMDKFEVTQEMFAKVQLPNPSHWQDSPQKPVERVRWRDAKQYCNERSLLEGLKPCYDEKTPGLGLRLCRQRLSLAHGSGMGICLPRRARRAPMILARLTSCASMPGSAKTRSRRLMPVAQKKPNRWGIFDLYGNVSEWCEDVYSPTFYKESPATDPPGRLIRAKMSSGSSAAGPGNRAPKCAVRPSAKASGRAIPTHVSSPITAASAVCAG